MTRKKQILDYDLVATVSQLTAYTGPNRRMILLGYGPFDFVAGSNQTVNNTTVVSGSGIGGGQWLQTESNRVSVTRFGVLVGNSLSAAAISANTTAFNSAINAGERLIMPFGVDVVVDGTLSTGTVPVNLYGAGLNAMLRLKTNVHLFDCATNNEVLTLENLAILPDTDIPNGYAVKVTGVGGNIPLAHLRNVIVKIGLALNGSGVKNTFGGGFWFVNPSELVADHCMYFGPSISVGTGFKLTNTIVSVSSTLERCKVYGASIGLDIFSTSQTNNDGSLTAGIEGVRVNNCDFVTTNIAINADSNGVYGKYYPVQLDIHGGHMNAFTACVKIRRWGQFSYTKPLVYMANDGSQGALGFDIDNCTTLSIENGRIFKNGVGNVNGVLLGAGVTDAKITNTQVVLAPSDAAVLITAGATRIRVTDTDAVNCGFGVVDNTGLAVLKNNYLNGVLNDPIHVPEDQTVQQGNTTNVTYYPLGNFGAFDNGGNIDTARFVGNIGTWDAGSRQDIDLTLNTRNVLTYRYESFGQQQAGSGLIAMRNADKTTSLFLVLNGAFQRATLTYLQATGFTGWPRNLSLVATTTAPTGTLAFSTINPAVYPPLNSFYVQGTGANRSSILTGNVRTTNAQSGFYSVLAAAGNGTPDTNRNWTLILSHDVTDTNKRTLILIDQNDSQVIYTGTINTTDGTGFTGWSRLLSDTFDLPKLVQGFSAASRSIAIQSGNFQTMALPSGFYSADNGVTGMPRTGQYWLVTVTHYENNTSGGDLWTGYKVTNLQDPSEIWSGGKNNTGGWLGWFKQGLIISSTTITAATQAVVNTKYITNNTTQVVITLPTDANSTVGDQVLIRGQGTGGWKLAQNAGQVIHGASDSTTGTGGSLASQGRYDTVVVEKIATNEFSIVANRGTLTIV